MELTAEEVRVLGCLIEKSYTTPDHYPLSTNALLNACNQKSSRDPVVTYSSREIDEISRALRELRLARIVRGSGMRTAKHKHVIGEALGLDVAQQSLLAVLMLRGPQSAGELKTRTERYVSFDDLAAVEQTLTQLSEEPHSLVTNIGRVSGQAQDRWRQTLSKSPSVEAGALRQDSAEEEYLVGGSETGAHTIVQPESGPNSNAVFERLHALEKRVAALENEWNQ